MRRVVASPLGWILLAGILLRVVTLGRWPVWIDEAYTLHDAFHDLPVYPVHYLLTRWVVLGLGDGEVALRLLPCLFGIGTVLLVGLHRPEGRRGHAGSSNVAALLLAVSSWHVFWSQSARYYSTITLLVWVAFVFAARPASPARSRGLVLGGLLCIVACFCHPSAAYFLPAFVVVAARPPGARWRRVVLAAGALAALVVVGRYAHLAGIHARFKGPGSLWQFATSYGFQTGPLLLLAAAAGSLPRRGDTVPAAFWFAALPVAGIALTSSRLFVTGYHAVATLPFVCVLAARCQARLGRVAKHVVLAALLVEQGIGLVLYHGSHGMRPRFREAAAVVREARADGAAVFATEVAPLAYYLNEDRRNLRWPAVPRPMDDWLLGELETVLRSGRTACLVVHVDDLATWRPPARAALERLRSDLLPVTVRLAGSFGPKRLDLLIFRSH